MFTIWCHTAPPILNFSQSKTRTLPYKKWGSGGIILWALLTVLLVFILCFFISILCKSVGLSSCRTIDTVQPECIFYFILPCLPGTLLFNNVQSMQDLFIKVRTIDILQECDLYNYTRFHAKWFLELSLFVQWWRYRRSPLRCWCRKVMTLFRHRLF